MINDDKLDKYYTIRLYLQKDNSIKFNENGFALPSRIPRIDQLTSDSNRYWSYIDQFEEIARELSFLQNFYIEYIKNERR